MQCANCKMILRAEATVCHICKTEVRPRPTLDEKLGLNEPAVRHGLLITASVLIGAILLAAVANHFLVGMQKRGDLNAAAKAEQIKRTKDPALPIQIGDSRGKVTERCGLSDASSTSEDFSGVYEHATYNDLPFVPRDCVGRFTFHNGRLVRINR